MSTRSSELKADEIKGYAKGAVYSKCFDKNWSERQQCYKNGKWWAGSDGSGGRFAYVFCVMRVRLIISHGLCSLDKAPEHLKVQIKMIQETRNRQLLR